MADINKVTLYGRLTRDPVVRYIGDKQTAICEFGVATKRRYLAGKEWKESTDFHNVKVWGKQGEFINGAAKKGSRIMVVGRLETETWDDKQTGKKQYKTVVVVEEFDVIDRSKNESVAAGSESNAANQSNDEDIPF